MCNVQHIAEALGQTKIAARVGVGSTAVNNAVTRGVFPCSWYFILKSMCEAEGIECRRELFNFKASSEAADIVTSSSSECGPSVNSLQGNEVSG